MDGAFDHDTGDRILRVLDSTANLARLVVRSVEHASTVEQKKAVLAAYKLARAALDPNGERHE